MSAPAVVALLVAVAALAFLVGVLVGRRRVRGHVRGLALVGPGPYRRRGRGRHTAS